LDEFLCVRIPLGLVLSIEVDRQNAAIKAEGLPGNIFNYVFITSVGRQFAAVFDNDGARPEVRY
jgi:hypothetical protein